jgi:hypothetical protein
MVKKLAVASAVFAISVLTAGSVAFAQTATPTSSPTPTVASTTTTPTPTTTVPGGAPSTGRAQ